MLALFLLVSVTSAPPLIDQTFICPEVLPNDEARKAADDLFVQLAISAGFDTPGRIVELRAMLLRREQCNVTLDRISGR